MAEKICQVKSNLEEVEFKENKGKEIPGTAKIIGNPKKASASVKKMSEVKERQVFKFGAEARTTVSDGDKYRKKKVQTNLNVNSATMNLKSPVL